MKLGKMGRRVVDSPNTIGTPDRNQHAATFTKVALQPSRYSSDAVRRMSPFVHRGQQDEVVDLHAKPFKA